MKLYSMFFLVAIILLQSSLSPTYAENIHSSFEGVVTPISDPVRLVRLPFNKIKFLKTETTIMIQGGVETKLGTTITKLEMWAEPFGDGLKQYIKTQGVEISAEGEKTNIPGDMLITAIVYPSGKMHLVNVVGTVNGEPAFKNVQLMQMLKEIFNGTKGFNSSQRYRTGDVLIEINMDLKIGMSIKAKGFVKGRSTFNNIPVLVVEFKGTTGFPMAGEKLDGEFSGISLIDLRNGVTVFSTGTILIPVETKESKGMLKVVEVLETFGPVDPENSHTFEKKLKTIKRLLDRGLISEEEAAEKRKEILQGL